MSNSQIDPEVGMSRIAILGLGRMGTAIADRVEHAGHDLSVWNRSTAAAEPFGARGVRVLDDPAGAWQHADLVITMLSDGPAVEDVALQRGVIGRAPADGVYMDMSTIGADASARIARVAEARGLAYLRAPVSGNPAVVAAGNLGLIISGPKATFDALRPTLTDIGPNLFYVGAHEQARIVKLAVNLMIAGTAQLLAEAVVLAGSYGVDRRGLLDVIGGSVMGSPFVKYKTEALVADDYRSTFTTRLLFKDLALAIDAANAAGVPLPLTAHTQQLTQACISTGMGDLDFMALLPRLRREAGLDAFESDDADAAG
jgi:3-hydroxyisobutyrate dehydrogenase-like beta-hydroxyacid dehydrogenase